MFLWRRDTAASMPGVAHMGSRIPSASASISTPTGTARSGPPLLAGPSIHPSAIRPPTL